MPLLKVGRGRGSMIAGILCKSSCKSTFLFGLVKQEVFNAQRIRGKVACIYSTNIVPISMQFGTHAGHQKYSEKSGFLLWIRVRDWITYQLVGKPGSQSYFEGLQGEILSNSNKVKSLSGVIYYTQEFYDIKKQWQSFLYSRDLPELKFNLLTLVNN